MELTTVQLSKEDAVLFVEFQKRFAFIKLIESIGGFQLRNGHIEIHFDKYGTIASVNKFEHFKAV